MMRGLQTHKAYVRRGRVVRCYSRPRKLSCLHNSTVHHHNHYQAPIVLDLFTKHDGGYTTVAVALALLISCALVFSAATVRWSQSQAQRTQHVADAAALSGTQVLARYETVAQVVNATVVTAGITGLVAMGASLVLAAIPGLQGASLSVGNTGDAILAARQSFARSAGSALKTLEELLPAAVAINAALVVHENSETLSFAGAALPFPQESSSQLYETLPEMDTKELRERTKELAEKTAAYEHAQKRMEQAQQEGWYADNVDDPSSLRGRAAQLAGLDAGQNPYYADPTSWSFGAAIMRARNYYAARLNQAGIDTSSPDELVASAARRAFYRYALGELKSSYFEVSEEQLSMELHPLPSNADEMRGTWLYTDPLWPCTIEEGRRVLHADWSSPGVQGPASGYASLQDLEYGLVEVDKEAPFTIKEMGRVALASTHIDNGFEFYWKRIVEASERYKQAFNERQQALREAKDVGTKSTGLFSALLGKLRVGAFKLQPPGRRGVVAMVTREGTDAVPPGLEQTFARHQTLPPGVAVAGAVLAPDTSLSSTTVLSGFFDGLAEEGSLAGQALDVLTEFWSAALMYYGEGWDAIMGRINEFLENLDAWSFGVLGTWMKNELTRVLSEAGIEPPDLVMKKPVLANATLILARSGYGEASALKAMVMKLPDSDDPIVVAKGLVSWGVEKIDGAGGIELGTFEIPGTPIKVPIKVKLSQLMGVFT